MKPLAQNTLIQSRYLIVQLIGKGGMGEVYLAVDQRLGSAVAIKRTFFAGDEMLGNAFEREARVLARLRHPVLPKVSDHFMENDQQFLVMEHISGEDLAKRIEALEKPFPLSWVMFWADQLLDALSYLHSHEPPIIHRDIKPQNLKLTDENHIVLLDFGLSKSSTGQTNLASGVKNTGSTGSVVGYTPHYAPMEQIRGIGTSPRSDLYALSATLYQLMTNVVPADALTRADAMLNGMEDPIRPVNELNPEVPPSVSEVILRAMSVSQDKRFATAREMQKTLRKAFAEMQQAMSAKTMMISGSDAAAGLSQPSSFEATEVMDPEALRAISNPVGGGKAGFSDSISQPRSSPHANLEATVAFESSGATGGVKQSDVKTEVFSAGGNSLPGPPEEPQRYPSEPQSPPEAQENFALTVEHSNFVGGAGAETYIPSNESYSPEATTPYVALEGNGVGAAAAAGAADFSSYQPAAEASPNFDSQPRERKEAVVSAPGRKSSTGKIVALLGGLFLFFVVVLAGAGGGYYYYTNYMGTAADPAPSPTPFPTIEPTPAPTSESVFAGNSNSATPSPTPTATPEPTATPVETLPNQPQVDRPETRPTPATKQPTPRPRPSATVKPAPTKRPGDIVQ